MHSGQLKKGEKLPSKRQLTIKLGVSQTTVERCYDQLHAEGYIISRARSGVFIEYDATISLQYQGSSFKCAEPTPSTVASPSMIDFHYGHTDAHSFPLNAWKKSVTKTFDLHLQRLCDVDDFFGAVELREQIVDYLFQSRGIKTSANKIVVGATTSYLLTLVCHMLREQTTVGFEDPGYPRAREIFDLLGKRVIPLHVTSEGLEVRDLYTHTPEIVYVTASHQYPLGHMMPINRRMQVLQYAQRHDALIIEDDFDGEFRSNSQPVPALHALDHHDNVIYFGTLSRTFLPSLHISYMVLPERWIERFQRLKSSYKQTVALSQQLALADFISTGEWAKHLNRMRNVYTKKRITMTSELDRLFGSQITIHGDHAGPRILLDVHLQKEEKQLIEEAKHVGVLVYPTSNAYIRAAPVSTLQFGFGGLHHDDIITGVSKIHKAWAGGHS